jgi:hypothetical protein
VTALLERALELDEFAAGIERAAAGHGGLVVVEGPAGIGKSELLGAARRRADGSMRVLWAQGSELERELPFGVVRQLFESLLADEAERARLLTDAAAAARPVFDDVDADADGGDVSFAALHGLYWLTVNLAGERPLLLGVDDLQ